MIYCGVAKKSFQEHFLNAEPAKKKSRAISVRLPHEVDVEVQKLAKKSGRSVTDIIVEALKYAFNIPK